MEGRRDERERLRAERQAADSQDAASALARTRRAQYLSLAAFAGVTVIGQPGGNNTSAPSTPRNVKGVAQVNAQLAGLTQSGQTLGDSSAPVTVTEFGDPQCPVCKAFSEQIAPDLISSEVKTGKVKYT